MATLTTDSGSPNDREYREKEARKWSRELALSEKELRKFWETGRRVVKRYLDIADTSSLGLSQTQNIEKYNVFWANIGVLKASLYANPPKPIVKREFDDYADDAARVAGIMMERLIRHGLDKPESDMNTTFRQVVEDRLIPGLGQAWFRYCPTTETRQVPGPMGEMIETEQITDEEVATDYIYWEDFWWSPARVWAEVRWVAKRVWLDKDEFKSRFPECDPDNVSWARKSSSKYGDKVVPDDLGVDKTEIFEIWCKTSKSVYWYSRSYETNLLDYCEDPLELEGFYPCPPPLLATHTTSNLTPRADYVLVQTQYRRLDNLALRVGLLEDAIQASGVYDKDNKELAQILTGNTNKMIPVDNWAMFAEKGGLKGVVDWFPLDMVVGALDKLRELFMDAKAQLYELTGISDIMRGVTEPRETATAQGLKAQYSSVRLQYLQGEVASFVQNSMRIKADIIAKHFQPETIIKNSLIELTPDGDMAPEAIKVIKDDWGRCYRIQVAADQLAIPDYNAERAGRMEFITALGQLISQAYPMIQEQPGSAVFLLQILQWGISSFRSAQTIEGVFDKAARALVTQMQQPKPPPPPDPAMIKAQADVQKKSAELQIDAQRAQMENASAQQKTQIESQIKQMEASEEVTAMWAKTYAAIASQRAKTQAQIADTKAKNRQKLNGRTNR